MTLSAFTALSGAAELLRDSPAAFDDLLVEVASGLDALVPAEGGGWVELDLDHGGVRVRSFHDEALRDSDIARSVLDTADDHPMSVYVASAARTQVTAPVRMSDLVGRAELHGTRAYAQLLGPLRIEHQAVVVTRKPSSHAAHAWAFNRSAIDFTDHEMRLLQGVRPLLTVIDHLMAHRPAVPVVQADRWGLTQREAQVLAYLATGMTADAIGFACGISGGTVRKHLEHAYDKLGCHDRVTAVLRYRSAMKAEAHIV